MTIFLALDVAAALDADRPAIGHQGDALTAGKLRSLAVGGGALLRGIGAQTIAFVGVSSKAFPVALFAAASARIPIAPLNYRLADAQLLDLVKRLDSPLVIADEQFTSVFAESPYRVITTDDWLKICEHAANTLDNDEVEPPAQGRDPAVLLFTSGTTSEPKCVILRHRNLRSYVFGTVEAGSADERDAALVSVPPYHIAGVGTVLTNVLAGRRLLYLPNFRPSEWVRLVGTEKVSFAMVVPTMLARIVDELGSRPTELPSLRTIAYGGAPINPRVLERAMDLFPDVAFVNAYGLTETSSTISVLGPEEHRAARASKEPAVRGRLRSVGRLIPGMEAQIRDTEGRALPVGETGALWVRGAQVSGEYSGTGSKLDGEGWFHTNDRASLDRDGYLYLAGRSDDIIIRGGENVAPGVIEDVIAELHGVSEVAVVGLPDDEWGERIVAVVVPHEGAELTPEDVQSWARSQLRSSRTPDEIRLHPELPRNDMGKVVRRVLRAQLTA
jgi:acyl-CoA synthetase (AMP-forming)/AMP-acid ligase II